MEQMSLFFLSNQAHLLKLYVLIDKILTISVDLSFMKNILAFLDNI